jgi:uncharacterized membrane protein
LKMAKSQIRHSEKPISPPENSTDASIEIEIEKRLESVLSNLPQVQRKQVVGQVVKVVMSEHYSGPLPHPRHLQEYNSILPGGAERIISMTEAQQRHNMEQQSKIVKCEIVDRHVGMGLGFAAFVLLIVLAYVAGMADKTILAGLLLGTAAIGGVVAFIKGRSK